MRSHMEVRIALICGHGEGKEWGRRGEWKGLKERSYSNNLRCPTCPVASVNFLDAAY
jgi:hypothetical protein